MDLTEAAKNNQNFKNLTAPPNVVSNQPTGGKFGNVEQCRQAGLCYKCGEKYMSGYHWKEKRK